MEKRHEYGVWLDIKKVREQPGKKAFNVNVMASRDWDKHEHSFSSEKISKAIHDAGGESKIGGTILKITPPDPGRKPAHKFILESGKGDENTRVLMITSMPTMYVKGGKKEHFRGTRLGAKSWVKLLEKALEEGFDIFHIDSTTPESRGLFAKLGYTKPDSVVEYTGASEHNFFLTPEQVKDELIPKLKDFAGS
ncbi:hypothetical protein ACFLQ2_01430 [archaeon]